MIVTEFYNGQGLGNQLWCYFVTRIIAADKGYQWGVKSIEKFKGKEFLELSWGLPVIGGEGPEGGPPNSLPETIQYYYKEKLTRHPRNLIDISKRDDVLLNVPDNTKIDGIMQSYDYIQNRRMVIKECLKIKPYRNITDYTDDNICIIHIRGGDFLGSSAFLQEEYYKNAMFHMKQINPNIKFHVVTDDVRYARKVCPDVDIIGGSVSGKHDTQKAEHHIGGPIWMDWTIIYNAKNLIISASSFSWWPTWVGGCKNVIAPMYWGDYKNSDGYWSCGDSLIPGWKYLNRQGQIVCYDKCLEEKNRYEREHIDFWG